MADSASSATGKQCDACKKTESKDLSLKRCNRCKSAFYCSRECQKADWKAHKKICAATAQATAATDAPTQPQRNAAQARSEPHRNANQAPNTSGPALEVHIEKPFHKLHAKTWLHGRSEKDVYKLLIDTYRLRMDDNYKLDGMIEMDSIYAGAPGRGQPGFRRFLQLAQRSPGILPEWWSPAKVDECVQSGSSNIGWGNLARPVVKHDIIDHYGHPLMPMQLRMFGEQVYGTGPGGQRADSMLKMQMMVENGEFRSVSYMDISRLQRR